MSPTPSPQIRSPCFSTRLLFPFAQGISPHLHKSHRIYPALLTFEIMSASFLRGFDALIDDMACKFCLGLLWQSVGFFTLVACLCSIMYTWPSSFLSPLLLPPTAASSFVPPYTPFHLTLQPPATITNACLPADAHPTSSPLPLFISGFWLKPPPVHLCVCSRCVRALAASSAGPTRAKEGSLYSASLLSKVARLILWRLWWC